MENQRDGDTVEINLLEVFHVLLEKLGIIAGVTVFCALVCFAVSKFALTPIYESTTKIYILNKTENNSITYSDVQTGTQLTKDYAELISSRYVLEEVIQELDLDIEYAELLDKISVTTPSDTRIVSITVEDTDPAEAMRIANTVREMASGHIQNVMDIDAVNVVETANMPTRKSGPSSLKWTVIGGMISFLVICAIILARYLLDDTIKSSEDVEKYLGLSTLALIPMAAGETEEKKRKERGRRRKA